jgi:hypothetical protein
MLIACSEAVGTSIGRLALALHILCDHIAGGLPGPWRLPDFHDIEELWA